MSKPAVSKRQKLKQRMTVGTWAKNVSAIVKRHYQLLNPKSKKDDDVNTGGD